MVLITTSISIYIIYYLCVARFHLAWITGWKREMHTTFLKNELYFQRPLPLPLSNAIQRATKVELVTFCWKFFAVSKIIFSWSEKLPGVLLNYGDEGLTLGVLPETVQQLKLLIEWTKCLTFVALERTRNINLLALEEKNKNWDLEWTKILKWDL